MGLRVRARRIRRPAWPERRDMPRPPVLGRTNNAAFSSSPGAVWSQWSWLRLLRRYLPVLGLALLLGTVIAGAGPAFSALPTGSAVTTAATYGSTLAVSRPPTTNSGDVLIASVLRRTARLGHDYGAEWLGADQARQQHTRLRVANAGPLLQSGDLVRASCVRLVRRLASVGGGCDPRLQGHRIRPRPSTPTAARSPAKAPRSSPRP